MQKKHITFYFLICLIFISRFPCNDALAGIERIDIQLQSGFYVPDNPGIIGEKTARYDVNGRLQSIRAAGFGYGYDINVSIDCMVRDWIFRVDFGGKRMKNGPDSYERAHVEYYSENVMTIYPVVFNVLREIDVAGSRVSPYAGAGIGDYIVRWSESFTDLYSEYRRVYYSKGTKNSVGVNFILGMKYTTYKKASLTLEYSYCFVPARIKLIRYLNYRTTSQANVGGSSFRLGIAYRL